MKKVVALLVMMFGASVAMFAHADMSQGSSGSNQQATQPQGVDQQAGSTTQTGGATDTNSSSGSSSSGSSSSSSSSDDSDDTAS